MSKPNTFSLEELQNDHMKYQKGKHNNGLNSYKVRPLTVHILGM